MKAVQGCQKLSKGHGDDDVVVETRALQVILGISRPFLPTTEGKSSQSDDYEYDQHDLSLSMHFFMLAFTFHACTSWEVNLY